jgi:hypothetical protein
VGLSRQVLGVFVAVQSLEGYYLTPRILGGRLQSASDGGFSRFINRRKIVRTLGVILAIPAIAIGKVFFKFLRELYQASYFYHAGDLHPMDAPSENLEERIAEAADTVLAEQEQKDEEDEKENETTATAKNEMPTIIEKPV